MSILANKLLQRLFISMLTLSSVVIYGASSETSLKKSSLVALLATGFNPSVMSTYCDSLSVQIKDKKLMGINTTNCIDGDLTCLVWHRLGTCKLNKDVKTCEMRCAKLSDLDEESIVVSKSSVYLGSQGQAISVIADDIKDNGEYPCTKYKPWGECQNITDISEQISYGDIDSILGSELRCAATCEQYKNRDCFSSSSLVYRKTKSTKHQLRTNQSLSEFDLVPIADLEVGDYVLDSISGNNLHTSKVTMISHEQDNGIFHTLLTDHGHAVTLSEHHRIRVKQDGQEFSKEISLVEPGESIYVRDHWEEVYQNQETNWFEVHNGTRMFYTESGKVLVKEGEGDPIEVLTCTTSNCYLEYMAQYLRLNTYAKGMKAPFKWEDSLLNFFNYD